jgi:hypothetical protein
MEEIAMLVCSSQKIVGVAELEIRVEFEYIDKLRTALMKRSELMLWYPGRKISDTFDSR